jgi:hypothetical protein
MTTTDDTPFDNDRVPTEIPTTFRVNIFEFKDAEANCTPIAHNVVAGPDDGPDLVCGCGRLELEVLLLEDGTQTIGLVRFDGQGPVWPQGDGTFGLKEPSDG